MKRYTKSCKGKPNIIHRDEKRKQDEEQDLGIPTFDLDPLSEPTPMEVAHCSTTTPMEVDEVVTVAEDNPKSGVYSSYFISCNPIKSKNLFCVPSNNYF